jgi:tetratricopeptide (TPR) repeat protein
MLDLSFILTHSLQEPGTTRALLSVIRVNMMKQFRLIIKLLKSIQEMRMFGTNKGMALRLLGRTIEADATFADAIEKWNSEGMDLSRLEKYSEAIKVYDTALAVDPNYVNSWINKGTSFFRLVMYEEAIAAFNQVIKIDPQHADAWNRKGIVLKKNGQKVEATDAFAKAKELGHTG